MHPTDSHRLHAHLIGRQGSRGLLNTPALVLDLDMLERNIAAMAAFARAHGIALRPHSKTHKSPDIARRQIAAGALGNCCAKLGEAEVMAEAGIGGLLITSPVVSAPAIERLMALLARNPDLMVTADHPDNVAALARAAAAAGRSLSVVVDIDPGMHRTGVASPEAALALARQIAAAPALRYAGVQFYCGRHQHIEAFGQRRDEITERTAYLKGIVEALTADGLKPAIVTGGGTGTHAIDAALGVFSELQVGSYVFMDHQYNVCDLRGDGRVPFEQALQIDARVVSAGTPGMATIDSGLKSMATEAGAPPILSGVPDGTTFRFAGDEHARITFPDGVSGPGIDAVVTLTPPHCDPTVNLYDAYHVVKGHTLVDIWPIAGRGRSR
ncbi:DSD1 family PLP-dependent enzyme [Vineibacter terrae]|uniref:DSD1 family PLP-dependent enzyme n=1 Tax=Vineibacter terrae TaxID=2586908 RepID=UPI002E34EFAD|nr:DSD1 family PLP-dependent enzyme [Vineibacter terrae]HEX2885316.1 DSD1 family PLP-dependent enzyme [Vineibacter terrae]